MTGSAGWKRTMMKDEGIIYGQFGISEMPAITIRKVAYGLFLGTD
jgi:hypothetical protein